MKIFLLCILLSLAACKDSPESSAGAAKELKKVIQNDLQYFRDPKTGLCFGYAWVRDQAVGGPLVVAVPCEAINKEAP